MIRLQAKQANRPSVWFLGPVIYAFVLHILSHRDFIWMSLCLTLICSAYATDRYVVWPQWKAHWPRILLWGGLLWMLAYFYFDGWMNAGRGLSYFPRFLFRPWVITSTSLWAAAFLVYLWYVPFHPKERGPAVLFVSGWVVLCSAQFVDLNRLYITILYMYCGSLALALFLAGRGHASLGSLWWPNGKQVAQFMAWCVVLAIGTWGVVLGLWQLEKNLPGFLGQFFRPPNFSGHLGGHSAMMIRRRQTVRLSSALVASISGPQAPGYIRTHVMTRYKRGLWTSLRTEFPLRQQKTAPKQRTFFLPGPAFAKQTARQTQRTPSTQPTSRLAPSRRVASRLLHYQVQTFQQLGGSMLLGYGTRRFVIHHEARCLLRMGHSVTCEPAHRIEEYQFSRRLNRPLSLGIGQASHEPVIASLPGVRQPISPEEKQALEEIYQQLRPLARTVAGRYQSQPLLAAQVIQSYFRQNYKYSLKVRLAPKGDPTVDFVLHKRPAFCEYFASGMVLMLRSLGIRARVASGFVTKEFHSLSGSWLIRQRDAHAWTEVYDAPNRRWVAFDPTSPQSISRPEVIGVQGFLEKWRTWVQLRWRQWVSWLRRVNYREWLTQKVSELIGFLWRWHTLVALLGLLLVRELWRLRQPIWQWLLARKLPFLPQPTSSKVPLLPLQEQASQMLQQMLTSWSKQGLTIASGETLEEFFYRIEHHQPLDNEVTLPPAASLHRWLQLYNRLRFLPADVIQTRQGEIARQLEELRQLTNEVTHA